MRINQFVFRLKDSQSTSKVDNEINKAREERHTIQIPTSISLPVRVTLRSAENHLSTVETVLQFDQALRLSFVEELVKNTRPKTNRNEVKSYYVNG